MVPRPGGILSVGHRGTDPCLRRRGEIRLFENLFRFAIATGATRVELERTADELVVTTDGASIPPEATERAFAYGEPVPDADSGTLLPVVRTLAEAHGWSVSIDPDYRDGIRIRITQ